MAKSSDVTYLTPYVRPKSVSYTSKRDGRTSLTFSYGRHPTPSGHTDMKIRADLHLDEVVYISINYHIYDSRLISLMVQYLFSGAQCGEENVTYRSANVWLSRHRTYDGRRPSVRFM